MDRFAPVFSQNHRKGMKAKKNTIYQEIFDFIFYGLACNHEILTAHKSHCSFVCFNINNTLLDDHPRNLFMRGTHPRKILYLENLPI